MDKSQLADIGRGSLTKARTCLKESKIFESLRHFLLALEFLPELQESLHTEFSTLLNLANQNLDKEDGKMIEDMHKCFKLALEYYPRSSSILTDFGTFLLMLQASEASVPYFLKALEYNPHDFLADKNLETAKLNLLPRWYFRMLNDKVRNNAYRTAIHSAITTQYNKVLDIGCGCGLLSYYALECNDTKNVVAIESSEELCKIAKITLGKFEKIEIINSHSTDLNGIVLSNLLVTEIFDAGFFGEWVLGSVIHAWDNLLEPSAKIVPCGGEIFVTGINCSELFNKHKLKSNIPGLENICATSNTTEPYQAEYLKHFNVQYITDTQSAVSVCLSDVDFLKNIYTSFDAIEPFTLKCTSSGTLHAFAIWFNLHLDDKVTITTNPHVESVTCWEQAIVYLEHPFDLQIGQEITLQFSCVANKVNIKMLNYTPNCRNCFKISQSMIRYLNDEPIVNAALQLELPNNCNTSFNILELNPFPLFMMYKAKKGIPDRYYFHNEDKDDLKFIEYIWKKNVDCKIYVNEIAYFDVIFINPISENGTISENIGKFSKWLKDGGVILPKAVKLQLQLIDSAYLDFCSRISDDNLYGFNISNYLNEYGINEHWQVEPVHFAHTALTQTNLDCDILEFCLENHTGQFHINTEVDGIANGILYWFNLKYSDNISVNTYHSQYYFSACFICRRRQSLKASNTVQVNIIYVPGFLKIDLCNKIEDNKS